MAKETYIYSKRDRDNKQDEECVRDGLDARNKSLPRKQYLTGNFFVFLTHNKVTCWCPK